MNAPKVSVANWCFCKEPMDPAAYYRAVVDAGCTAVEMATQEHWPVARQAGLGLLNISGPGAGEGFNHVENHPLLLVEVRKTIELAAKNGVEQVIVFSGNSKGQAPRDGFANCHQAFKGLAEFAREAGTTLLFEMFNTFDHPDYQASQSSYGFELARAIDNPAFKVLYDVYHMYRMGEDVRQDLVANLEWIGHLHVAGGPKRDFPGSAQAIDYPSLVRDVQLAGYNGFWGLEFLSTGLQELSAAVKHLSMDCR